MSKPLPEDDFRASRTVLEPDDFALHSGEDPPPSDLVGRETWASLTALSDDVAIRTTNHHGSALDLLDKLWRAWVDVAGKPPTPLFDVILDATDEFQASTFNAMHGFYRQGVSCLRNALEQLAIGAYYETVGERFAYKRWRAGQAICSFGHACDGLNKAPAGASLNSHLRATLQGGMFNPKTDSSSGGWARRLYSALSDYAHSRPGLSNGDIWQSNGPIYVADAFCKFVDLHIEAATLGFILVKIGRPAFRLPPTALHALRWPASQQPEIARAAVSYLFPDGGA